MRYAAASALTLLIPLVAIASDPKTTSQGVEQLLPADGLFYFRYDGYEAHRKAYDRTALGQAMKGDLGELLEYLTQLATEALTSSLKEKNPQAAQQLAGGRQPFLNYLWRHGLAGCVEAAPLPPGAKSLPFLDLPLRLRLTVVFPDGGTAKNRAMLTSLLSALVAGTETAFKNKQVGRNMVHEYVEDDFRVVWWQQQGHLMLVVGNDRLEPALQVINKTRPNLSANPLYQRLAAFRDYETDLRGFVRLDKVFDLWRTPTSTSRIERHTSSLMRSVALQQFGLTGIQSASFHLGFDRQYQRSTILLDVVEPAKRAGLLRLAFAPVAFDPARLPALPPDAASVRVSQVEWQTLYKVVRHLAMLMNIPEALSTGVAPKDPLLLPGVDFPRDILAHLDSTLLLYRSMSEGPFFLGQVVAIKVKDEQKLGEGLQKLTAAIKAAGGLDVQKRTYRGVDMVVFEVPSSFVSFAPTYAVHQGWLVLSLLPQPAKGFILRSEGKHKSWQPPALVAEALAQARKHAGPRSKLAAVTVTDPRPNMAVGLSVLPLFAAALGKGNDFSFDVSKLPSAQAVTDWQFPGVTVFYDDGNVLRWENHYSIDVPEDWMLLFLLPRRPF
jgi:hypothetical protein